MVIYPKASYDAVFSSDGKYLYNVGTEVKKIDIENKKTIFTISKLKNPSNIALSEEETVFAFSNTKGALCICDCKTGDIISTIDDIKEEGNQIYISDSHCLFISSSGNLLIYNFLSNKRKIINNPNATCAQLMPTESKDIYLAFFNDLNEDTLVVEEINITNGRKKVLYSKKNLFVTFVTICKVNMNYYFIASYNRLGDSVWKYDYTHNALDKIIVLPEEIICKNTPECVSVNESENILAIGYGNVYLYSLENLKCIKTFDANYLSCLKFINNNFLFIGSWEKAVIEKL